MHDKLKSLLEYGQSMWYDNIARDLLESGQIKALIDQGIRGLTSNPAIFKKAITAGNAYDAQLADCKARNLAAEAIFEELAVQDIRAAADLLKPVYEESGGHDGFVSLEVSPTLAHDTQGTIEEAAHLWQLVDRENLMIKIPATQEGLSAITESIANGINVNVTLIFSRDMYEQVMAAYSDGLERRIEGGLPVSQIASVASFFVSRVDSLVDSMLDGKHDDLKGKAGIANAKLAYQLYKAAFSGKEWAALEAAGAKKQRPLWASTSTKNPAYPDTMYVDQLIGENTVNTAPPHTIDAFLDHGTVAASLESDLADAQSVMQRLAEIGIDMDAVTDQLLREGVVKFETPYKEMLVAITDKVAEIEAAPGD